MRVLRLDLGADTVELHPFVTVVRGLAPASRQRLLDVLGGVPAGRAPVGGVIEAHGVLLDLAPATLGLLDLDHPLDIIVRAVDLPHRGTDEAPEVAAARRQAADADAALKAAEAAVADALKWQDAAREALELASSGPVADADGLTRSQAAADSAAMTRAEAERAADQARASHTRALDALHEAERAAEAARGHRQEATRAVSVAVAALESASERRDTTAAAVVDAARRRLAEAEEALAAVRRGEEAATDHEAAASSDALRADRMAAEAALLALDTIDPLPVKRALSQLRDPSVVELVPSPEALELAERWAILTIDLAKAGMRGDEELDDRGDARLRARQRVEAAEAAVAEIEAVMRGPVLDPSDVAELEQAYEEVNAAREAAEKRFGAAKAAKRLEQALAAEQEILDRLGFVSWADYRLGSPGAAVSSEDEMAEKLMAARLELAAADAEHQALEASVSAELARAEVLDRRRKLRAAAVRVLGEDPGDDVEGALRRHRVPAATTGDHLNRLRQALEGAGLVLADEDVDERLLSDLARVWLKEQQDTAQQQHELEAMIAGLDVRLAELEALERSPVAGEPLAAAAGAVEDARVALAAAEARLDRDSETAGEIDRLRLAFEDASAAEETATAAVSAADERVLAAAAVAREEADAVARLERAVAGAIAAQAAAAQAAVDLDTRVASARIDGLAAVEQDLAEATTATDQARAVLAARSRAAADAHAAVAAAEQRTAAGPFRRGDDFDGDGDSDADDTEWYLLARLAAQRSVSFAGSVPLVLDDALAGFDPDTARGILERLERMASTVQVVLVTEDLFIASWAESLGPDRAYVAEGGGITVAATGS